ncbi:MAG: hypothetical protein ACJ740_01510 [Gaiellales bacterium]
MATLGCVLLVLRKRRLLLSGRVAQPQPVSQAPIPEAAEAPPVPSAPIRDPRDPQAEAKAPIVDAPIAVVGQDAEGELVAFPLQYDDGPSELDDVPSPAERKLEQLAELRAQLARSVDRRALFGMARDRGLPHHQIFFMTSHQLLDAIISAEGLPPADVLPSRYTEERMSAIAAEARLRHDEIVLAEAAELDAG